MSNYAFIDSQNLNLGVREQGWRLDFKRFRVYLFDKYRVSKAFIFIGFMPENLNLYKHLVDSGYVCIFKPTLLGKGGVIKGNCDAELVLHTMIELKNFDKAVIVSGDGDFQCLINHLIELDKLEAVLIPNMAKYSGLLKTRAIRGHLRFVSDLKNKLAVRPEGNAEQNKKNPRKD